MGVHFPAVELDNVIRFSTLSRVSGYLWHSLKWADRFLHFLQHTSGLEILACNFNTYFNYDYYAPTVPFLEPRSKVAATFRGKMDFKINFSVVFSKTDT